MDAEILYEAIGEIREDLILDAEASHSPARRRLWKPLMAACLALFLIVIPVQAEMKTGYVSNLLAPFYGSAQTELVDSIGVPVGASVTVEGYTLSADAIIGDRYNLAIVYTLTREDGGTIPEGTHFSGLQGTIGSFGSGGGHFSQQRSEDGSKLFLVEQWTSQQRLFLFRRSVRAAFQDLVTGSATIAGPWELRFTLRYQDTTQTIPAKDLQVRGSSGASYQINRILLSPLGLHIDVTAPSSFGSGQVLPDFTVSLVLTDGSLLPIQSFNCGGSATEGKPTMRANWGTMFDQPIPPETIQALILCDTTVPLK